LLNHRGFAEAGSVVPFDRSESGMRAAIGDYVHAAGSCAMGVVVDARCRLRGYDGVVVCDASVMPNLPRANTHLPTVMIAERVAAMLSASLSASAS
jgi:choline dehydrogenase-like flavoprotein